MARNTISYQRFTALPANIAQYGATVEEIRMQQGQPAADPVLSPMATHHEPELRLALAPAGSDRLRLAQPQQPVANPYEGPKATLILSRSAVRKLRGHVVAELQRLIEANAVADPQRSSLMRVSMHRVTGACAHLEYTNALAEQVDVRRVGAAHA